MEDNVGPNVEEEPIEHQVKRKRGVRNDENYKRNMIKKARLKGEAYTSSKGKGIKEAEIGTDCK